MKVLISTIPFADRDKTPLRILDDAGVDYVINPLGRKFTGEELYNEIGGFDALIAGTESINEKIINSSDALKLIARVGVGVDNVDLLAARNRGVAVCYTPDAPSPAVAELTIAVVLTMLRQVHVSNYQMHNGVWHRFFGRRLSKCTVGVIGVGRIGRRVIRHLSGFDTKKILANDLNTDHVFQESDRIEWCDKESIYRDSDIITVHVPLTTETRDMIGKSQLDMMKNDAILVNTSRGGIINEQALFDTLNTDGLAGAAIDVFEEEPYQGKLQKLENCLLTAHMGSMSVDCRARMEIEATEDVVRYLNGMKLHQRVPESEYQIQKNNNCTEDI